jgi:hypothetical protein
MDRNKTHRQRNGCLQFLADFRALFIKMFLLTKRSVGQTIAEFILSLIFLGLLLALRYVFDRDYYSAYQISRFRPQDSMSFSELTANITYYYPGKLLFIYLNKNLNQFIIFVYTANPCTTTIVNNTISGLSSRWPSFPTAGM